MNFELSKEQELIQKAVKEYAEKVIIPVYQQIDQDNKVPPEIFRGLADLDLFGLQYPEEYGGTGAGYSCYSLVLEQISRASSGVAMTYAIHSLAISAIFLFGTPEQKTRYMPSACKGQTISSFAFTEPSTGSDPRQITTTAARNGDHYIVNGTKRFISVADLDGPIVVFARDDSGEITSFIVDKNCPGYSVSEPWHKLGYRGGNLLDVYLKNVRVPAENVLGPQGQGYTVLRAAISFGKIAICSCILGEMQAALELSINYAREKAHRNGTIGKFPTVQLAIAKMAEKTEAARWLCYRLAYLAEKIIDGKFQDFVAFAKEAALTKAFVTEAGVDVSRLAVGVHGSYGLMEDYKVSMIYRDMIIGEQIEGVNDMQRLITAGVLLNSQSIGLPYIRFVDQNIDYGGNNK